jgi:trans-aconitate methyltransferase
MALIRQIAPDKNSRILDVGRSVFTNILLASYPNVQTLGFGSSVDSVSAVSKSVPHIAFDLNRVQHSSEWIKLPQFDLIVFAEVIEHLYTAPEVVMQFLCSGLAKGGCCIVQTPNAVSLHKCILFICGRNPYERIRVDNTDPGHFREYTKRELLEIGGSAGMIAIKHDYRNYFGVWHGGRAKK